MNSKWVLLLINTYQIFDIPDVFQECVIQNLICKCGFGGEYPSSDDSYSGMFDIYMIDYRPLKNLAEINGFTLYEDELGGFKKYLLKFPILAFKHPAGSKLYSILQTNLGNRVSTLQVGSILYRGRLEIVNDCMLCGSRQLCRGKWIFKSYSMVK